MVWGWELMATKLQLLQHFVLNCTEKKQNPHTKRENQEMKMLKRRIETDKRTYTDRQATYSQRCFQQRDKSSEGPAVTHQQWTASVWNTNIHKRSEEIVKNLKKTKQKNNHTLRMEVWQVWTKREGDFTGFHKQTLSAGRVWRYKLQVIHSNKKIDTVCVIASSSKRGRQKCCTGGLVK